MCACVCTCVVAGEILLVRFELTAQKMVELFKRYWRIRKLCCFSSAWWAQMASVFTWQLSRDSGTKHQLEATHSIKNATIILPQSWLLSRRYSWSSCFQPPTRSADVSKVFTTFHWLNPPPGRNTSLLKHQIKAHNGNANSEYLQDLGCHICMPYLYPSFLWRQPLKPVRPFRRRRLSISHPFNHHQHGSVSCQWSTFSAWLLWIKIKPLSSTAAFFVPFVE